MNPEKPIAAHSADLPQPTSDSAFPKLFTAGVIGWLVGTLIVFGLSWPLAHPESVAIALLWTISHWWAAFALGLLSLIGYALVRGNSFALAMRAYLLPVALLAGIAWVCQWIYPDKSFREDLFTYLPVVIIFYGFGCLWMQSRKDKESAPAFARSVIPPLVGGLVILGFVAIPVFASNAFRYRDAFQLTISKLSLNDGAIVGEGTIEIRKPGNYAFAEPRYLWDEMETLEEGEPGIEIGTITWGSAGVPKADALGVFPMQVTWRKGILPSYIKALPASSDSVYIEVRDPNGANELIYSLVSSVQRP